MNILSMLFSEQNFRLSAELTGDSDAIFMPPATNSANSVTVVISSVSSSAVRIQYTLGRTNDVRDDTAIWHETPVGNISDTDGVAFDSPVSFVRVVCDDQTTTYRLEALA